MNAETPFAESPRLNHAGVTQSLNTEAESECLLAAQELHRVLQEEADILRRFAKADLLHVISKKEFLLNELGQKLQSLKDADEQAMSISGPLKDILKKIDQVNRSNRLFIQRSLGYWQDLLSIFIPSGYGRSRSGSAVPRGFAFSREV
jgi:flagellar biosynthesis/type III secretory pathway chaperone